MKKNSAIVLPITLLMFSLVLVVCSCRDEEQQTITMEVKFSISPAGVADNKGARTKDLPDPTNVIVTIRHSSGNTVEDQRKLDLYKFGEGYFSVPITLTATGEGRFYLTEFLVLGPDGSVQYATPRNGSSLAHLVSHPLDIEFIVHKEIITTVTPEVVAVNENSSPADYGYGQFGFNVVNKIQAVFSSFIEGTSNFELTESHIKIEGLRDTASTDTTALWAYETELEAKANTVFIRQAVAFRVTVTKPGYNAWCKRIFLKNNDKMEIMLEEKSDWDIQTIWNKHYGGSSTDTGPASISTVDGGLLIVNGSYSGNHDVTNHKGQADIWVVKLNASGEIEWSGNFGGSLMDWPESVTEFPDGSGYVITAKTTSTDGDVGESPKGWKGWLLKVDRHGNLVWQKTTDQTLFLSSAVAFTGFNNILLIGAKTFGNAGANSNIGSARQIDENGNVIWEKTYSFPLLVYDILKNDGAYLLAPSDERALIKMNALGEIEWRKTVAVSGNVYAGLKLCPLPDGYMAFGTKEVGYIDSQGKEWVVTDIVAIKLNTEGSTVWEKTIPSSSEQRSELLACATQTTYGNYVLAGSLKPGVSDADYHDGFLIEITPQGEIIGQRDFRGQADPSNGIPAYSFFTSVIPSGDGYVMTGATNDNGGDIPGNHGGWDVWAMKVKF